FQGGRFDPEDAIVTGNVLTALVMGLPAYVLVKVLVPNFYARADTRTPVYAAVTALTVFVAFNVVFLERFGVVGVAAASAIGAWINASYLFLVLARRSYYRVPGALFLRMVRQLVAAAAMGAALWFARDLLSAHF